LHGIEKLKEYVNNELNQTSLIVRPGVQKDYLTDADI
jgi:hypothetical protein